MKLVIAIIQNEYVEEVLKSLLENKIRATRMSSTGGFLKSGNTTLLIGIEKERVDDLVGLIRDNTECKKVDKGDEKIPVRGANLFILNMDHYERF